MISFKTYINEKTAFKVGDVIVNHLGLDRFKKITIKEIKNNQYITDNGKIDIKFQDSYKLAK